jgi:hypothetical protein
VATRTALDVSALLLDTLGYCADEFVSIGHDADGQFSTAVLRPADAARYVAKLPNRANVYFGVNPVAGPARQRAGRGTADDVTRLAALWADLDVKPGACQSLSVAHAIIDDLSTILGTRPSAITHSGNGLHPYWPVSTDDQDGCNRAALVKRWGRLVTAVAETRGARTDSVYDLARMLRAPGTHNRKASTNGHAGTPVVAYADNGGPLTIAEIDERLTEFGIYEEADDTKDREQISNPADWKFSDETCNYITELIAGLPDDGPAPGGGRHQWLLKQCVRLACAVMVGCITKSDYREAKKALAKRFTQLCASREPRRKPGRFEISAALAFGVTQAATKTRKCAMTELGDHEHSAGDAEQDENDSVLDTLAFDGASLDAEHFEPLHYAVDGLIPEGLGILVAPPKKGKSWLVIDIALAVASGSAALGAIAVTKRPVLVLALEDGKRRLQSRSRLVLGGQPIPAGVQFITKAKPAEALTAIAEFMARHHDEYPLVILDTFGKVKRQKRPGEEAYLVDYEMGTKLKDLADAAPGSSLVVVHHARKAEVLDFVDSVSGTNGIAGAVDFVMVLNRQRLSDDAVLSVTGRDVIEAEYALQAEDGMLWQLNGPTLADARQAADEAKTSAAMGDRKMEVFRFVVNWHGDKPVTARDVAAALGMDNDTAGKYLRRLATDGYITKAARGQYLYFVSESSESSESDHNHRSESQNNSDTDSDTDTEVSETDSDTSDTSDGSDTSDTSDSKCERCGQTLLAPLSIERGRCERCIRENAPP